MSIKPLDVPSTGEILDEQGLNIQVAAFKSLIGEVLALNFEDKNAASLETIAKSTAAAIVYLGSTNNFPSYISEICAKDADFIIQTRYDAIKLFMVIALSQPNTRMEFATFINQLNDFKVQIGIFKEELDSILNQLIQHLKTIPADIVLPEYITEMSQFLERMKFKLGES